MKPPVSFRQTALDDLERAEDWYESQKSGLGSAFQEEVANAVSRISAGPESYPVLYKGARRVLLRRFPYALSYRFEGLHPRQETPGETPAPSAMAVQ